MTKLHWGHLWGPQGHRSLVRGGDGEGADVTLRTGGPRGATSTSMEQVQHVGQQGDCPVHFVSVGCSVRDCPGQEPLYCHELLFTPCSLLS